jgi:hypothetical protein
MNKCYVMSKVSSYDLILNCHDSIASRIIFSVPHIFMWGDELLFRLLLYIRSATFPVGYTDWGHGCWPYEICSTDNHRNHIPLYLSFIKCFFVKYLLYWSAGVYETCLYLNDCSKWSLAAETWNSLVYTHE